MGAFSRDEEGEAERGVDASEYAGEMGTLFTCTGVVATGVGATVTWAGGLLLSEEGGTEEVPTRVSGMGATAARVGPLAATLGGAGAGAALGDGTTLGGDGDTTTTAVGGGATVEGGGVTVPLGLL